MKSLWPSAGDGLIIVDVQSDFSPGGKLAVAGGDAVIAVLNRAAALFARLDLPVVATRDWHPANHCSFTAQRGTWPPHRIAGSAGAGFPAALVLPDTTLIVSEATTPESDAYSGFQGTELASLLHERAVARPSAAWRPTIACSTPCSTRSRSASRWCCCSTLSKRSSCAPAMASMRSSR